MVIPAPRSGFFSKRPTRRATLAAGAAVGAGSIVFASTGCGSSGDDGAPVQVNPEDLSDRQEELDGVTVETSGVVRRFDDIGGTYFVVEDDARNRVRVEPAERFMDSVGDRVVVIGRFDWDEERGRRIEVTRVLPPT